MTAYDEHLVDQASVAAARVDRPGLLRQLARNWSVVFGATVLALMVAIAVLAPALVSVSPDRIDPSWRNKKPGTERVIVDNDGNETPVVHWMGTDTLGRDVYSRVVYGARVSMIVGISVAALSVAVGLVIGLLSGYLRWLDGIVMRVMDGLMAIPGILLALGLLSLWGAGLATVIVAITVPEVPRVVRLVRAIVLSIREEPYVEAAVSVGTRLVPILDRHVLPNTVA
ncbi:MAG: ABC transporter permease, partial [Alphaproteobacteria bacterium]